MIMNPLDRIEKCCILLLGMAIVLIVLDTFVTSDSHIFAILSAIMFTIAYVISKLMPRWWNNKSAN